MTSSDQRFDPEIMDGLHRAGPVLIHAIRSGLGYRGAFMHALRDHEHALTDLEWHWLLACLLALDSTLPPAGRSKDTVPDGWACRTATHRAVESARAECVAQTAWRDVATKALETGFRLEMARLMHLAVAAGSPQAHRAVLATAQECVRQHLAARQWIDGFEAPSSPHTAQS